MLFFMLAINSSTKLPGNHVHCLYWVPIIWLCKIQWRRVGERLKGCRKHDADVLSDYIYLHKASAVDNMAVFCTLAPPNSAKMKIKAFEDTDVEDWVIQDAHVYAEARLISDMDGEDKGLAIVWENC